MPVCRRQVDMDDSVDDDDIMITNDGYGTGTKHFKVNTPLYGFTIAFV